MANVLYFSLSNERIKLMLLHIRWILSVLNRDSNKIISNEKKNLYKRHFVHNRIFTGVSAS